MKSGELSTITESKLHETTSRNVRGNRKVSVNNSPRTYEKKKAKGNYPKSIKLEDIHYLWKRMEGENGEFQDQEPDGA